MLSLFKIHLDLCVKSPNIYATTNQVSNSNSITQSVLQCLKKQIVNICHDATPADKLTRIGTGLENFDKHN